MKSSRFIHALVVSAAVPALLFACAATDSSDAVVEDAQDTRVVDDSGPTDAPAEAIPDARSPEDTGPDTSPPGPFNYLIVTADGLTKTAQAFADYRTQTGYKVLVRTVSELAPANADDGWIGTEISEFVAGRYKTRVPDSPFYLLIVGDADAEDNDRATCVPSLYWPGGWEGAYSDNFYADVDGDDVPDLAVGRIPVRTDQDGLLMLEKVKAHETTYTVGPWNHRIHVWAGEGGFGEDIDLFIETIATKGLEAVPYDYDLVFAYRNPDSNYYYFPFEEKIHDLLTEGSVMVTYMGHGGGELDVPDLSKVIVQNRQAFTVFFACGTGDYIGANDCETEKVLKLEGGPMAAIVSQTTTHPYGNAINAIEVENAVFLDNPDTIGEAMRLMKWRSLYNTEDPMRQMIDSFAVLYVAPEEMVFVVEDHMYSYNLLGDPAARIRKPEGKVTLEVGDAKLGSAAQVSGTVVGLDSGTAHVAIVAERTAILEPLTPVEDPHDPANTATVQANWEKAVSHTVATADLPVTAGAFSGTIDVPTGIPVGNYHVTVYVEDGTKDALGSVPTKLKKADAQ